MPRSRAALALGLALLVLAAYEGVRRCGFVSFDDDVFVYQNPYVRQGLTWAGLRWALAADLLFESAHADYWIPVTVLSRMLDVQLFGLNAAGHHVMNALLHAANAVLVLLMLDGLTGARHRSAFAAAMFAVHPLAVESVAWVTERKDVLSATFWMLSVIAYGRYARGGGRGWYAAAAGLMALGLMAKPTLVALPLVLVVLDFWPLQRWRAVPARRLLAEKVPFFLLAAASAAVTILSHARGGHLASAAATPLASRVANALWSLVVYLEKTVWPTGLAVFYPLREGRLMSGRTLAAVAVLGLVAWLAARGASRRPYLVSGSCSGSCSRWPRCWAWSRRDSSPTPTVSCTCRWWAWGSWRRGARRTWPETVDLYERCSRSRPSRCSSSGRCSRARRCGTGRAPSRSSPTRRRSPGTTRSPR